MSKKANRLADETSTYLLQHAYNPVDWYPWSQEALDASRKEDKPILLSIGYSACHWCHVMEHESFEDEDTAALMNKLFINIKVDREERQDLDEIYIRAVQVMTGHGGWPMTVFLTPDLKPFFAGTYFPPENKHGMPSFKRVMLGVAQAWKESRADILESAAEITEHIAKLNSITNQSENENRSFNKTIFSQVLQKISGNFDPKWGGFGGAPKFPHPSTLQLLLRIKEMTQGDEQKQAEQVLETTLDKMALGGIWDHLSGGFARYSTDRRWLVPHFEKMLYDNALLAPVYFNAYLSTNKEFYKEIGCAILNFVHNELTSDDGVFYSSLDADSEGEEGKFYVFTRAEILEILGKGKDEDEGKWFAEIYGATEEGNFEHHTNVLHLLNIRTKEEVERAKPLIEKLLQARSKRVRPGRDDKILTSWSALMISALVSGYRATKEPVFLARAKKAAAFLLSKMEQDGNLARTYGRGKARLTGYLDDYAYLIQALLDLSACDPNPLWFDKALLLTKKSIEYFYSSEEKDFYYTPINHESLILRPKNYFDGAVPSGTSVLCMNLIRLSKLTENENFDEIALATIGTYASLFGRAPDQFANMLCALDMHLSKGKEIAIVLDVNDSERQKFLETALCRFAPNDVELVKTGDTNHTSPLFDGRDLQGGKSTAYICQNHACQEPITDIDHLAAALHCHLVKSSQKETRNK
ncbi:MAG: thioredoxin domain-containing protein [Candidatus Melainabacteria bacterium]|nr:thioredoxin domain-containing protein [Candidatus Melainabacteria bacterium]